MQVLIAESLLPRRKQRRKDPENTQDKARNDEDQTRNTDLLAAVSLQLVLPDLRLAGRIHQRHHKPNRLHHISSGVPLLLAGALVIELKQHFVRFIAKDNGSAFRRLRAGQFRHETILIFFEYINHFHSNFIILQFCANEKGIPKFRDVPAAVLPRTLLAPVLKPEYRKSFSFCSPAPCVCLSGFLPQVYTVYPH